MESSEHRQLSRDSLFVMADLRVDGVPGEHRIKVRNLSCGGMMGEGSVPVARGTRLSVNLRNIGWTRGAVAWVQDNRFGVAFEEEIDPLDVRAPAINDDSAQVVSRPWLPGRSPLKSPRKL
jgi:hypothetical protein